MPESIQISFGLAIRTDYPDIALAAARAGYVRGGDGKYRARFPPRRRQLFPRLHSGQRRDLWSNDGMYAERIGTAQTSAQVMRIL